MRQGSRRRVGPALAMAEFQGEGLTLDADGVAAVCETLGVHAAELWAVLSVETRGCGFLADRRPLILFERHYFSRLTSRKFDDQAPDISNGQWAATVAAGANTTASPERCSSTASRRSGALHGGLAK